MNPFLCTDGYKVSHHRMYPEGTTLVYSNFTPRSNKYAPKGCDHVVSFGQQMVVRQIREMFDEHFFLLDKIKEYQQQMVDASFEGVQLRSVEEYKKDLKDKVCHEIKKEYSLYLNTDYDVSHIEALWDLGYLPIKVKAIPEGTLVPIGVPVLTIYNTLPEFYWLTNFLETLISNLLWKPMTSATIAHRYKKNLLSWVNKTDEKSIGFIEFQGHDFSMRGMDSIDATISSGLGHATSFMGSDSLPVIHGARKYYDSEDFVVGSVNATEHSVMCAGTKDDEIGTFRYLMKQFPTGILSIVSDTWDLWKVITEYLPILKDEILARDGKIVIRPDSGDPVDIVCGTITKSVDFTEEFDSLEELKGAIEEDGDRGVGHCIYNGVVYKYKLVKGDLIEYPDVYENELKYFKEIGDSPETKGVIELLWDIFGGTINEQGYKVLDPHIGAIYGDSITVDRAEKICKRLEAKKFASTNIVLGIGSFTYQYNTRDTFGFAMKATYVEVKGRCTEFAEKEGSLGHPSTKCANCTCNEGREIFKDPVTDDGTKKSAKGLLCVALDHEGNYALEDQVSWIRENDGSLQTIFENGELKNQTTLQEIRNKLNQV